MTPAETAEKLAGMLRGFDLDARVHCLPDGGLTVCVGNGAQEEPVFRIMAESPGAVEYMPLRLGRTVALRAKTVAAVSERDIRQRCADIANRVREHTANREAQQVAWAVADRLKALGLTCTATDGRVVITLSLSPEYAETKGPRIVAVLAERDAT